MYEGIYKISNQVYLYLLKLEHHLDPKNQNTSKTSQHLILSIYL